MKIREFYLYLGDGEALTSSSSMSSSLKAWVSRGSLSPSLSPSELSIRSCGELARVLLCVWPSLLGLIPLPGLPHPHLRSRQRKNLEKNLDLRAPHMPWSNV